MTGEVTLDAYHNVQKEKARVDFEKVLDQDSSHVLSLQNLTKIAMDEKDYHSCIKYIKRTIEIKLQENRGVEKEYINLYKTYLLVVSSSRLKLRYRTIRMLCRRFSRRIIFQTFLRPVVKQSPRSSLQTS